MLTDDIYIIHGAFKRSVTTIDWHIDNLLRIMCYLFSKCSAERTFPKIATNIKLPLKSHATHWLKGVVVTEGTLLVWTFVNT